MTNAANTNARKGNKKNAAAALPVDAIDANSAAISENSLLAELTAAGLTQGSEVIEPVLGSGLIADTKGDGDADLLELSALLDAPTTQIVVPTASAPVLAGGDDSEEMNDTADKSEDAADDRTPPTGAVLAADVNPEAALLGDLLDAAVVHDQQQAQAAADAAAAPAEGAPAPKKTTRPPTFAKTSEKIAHKLGDKMGEFILLELADATLEAEELKAKQAEVLAACDGASQIKVREKMVQLFGWARNGGKLNEVMRRSFVTLAKDGFLTSGDKGNLHCNLLEKPYSVGTARAQSNQIFSLFPILKIVNKTEKGRYELNPESALFALAKQQLGL